MNENRKQVIINEIKQWKKNRMLPSHYCDYLLALYTEGEPQNIGKNNKERTYSVLFLLFIPAVLFLTYFTELSIILQIAIPILIAFLGVIYFIYFFRKGILLQIPLFVSAFIFLLSSVEFVSAIYPNTLDLLYLTLIFNCLLWLLTGWKLQLEAFIISGIIGGCLILISIFI